MKTKRSILAFFFQFFGWLSIGLFTPLYIVFLLAFGDIPYINYEESWFFILVVLSVILTGIVFGSIFIFIGNLIQKIWNMEYYLMRLAENSNPVISNYPTKRYEEKPIEALKAAVKPSATPKDDDDDVSKYAPR